MRKVVVMTVLAILMATCVLAQAPSQIERERTFGKDADDTMLKSKVIIEDQGAQVRLDNIGGALVKALGQTEFEFHFRLIDDKNEGAFSAFSVPGGYVYISKEMFNSLSSDNELAGVLAHEVMHCALHHWINENDKANKNKTLMAIADFFTNKWASTFVGIGQLKYSRENEAQADDQGITLMTKAGFDPMGFVGLMSFLASKGHDALPAFLSTHPDVDDRYKKAYDRVVKPNFDEVIKKSGWPIAKVALVVTGKGTFSDKIEAKKPNIHSVVAKLLPGYKVELAGNTAANDSTIKGFRINIVLTTGEKPAGSLNIVSEVKIWDSISMCESKSPLSASWIELSDKDFDKKLNLQIESVIKESLGESMVLKPDCGVVVRSTIDQENNLYLMVNWLSKTDGQGRYNVLREKKYIATVKQKRNNRYILERGEHVQAGDILFPTF